MQWNEDDSSGIWGPVLWNTKEKSHGVLPFYYTSPETQCVFPLFYHNEADDGTTLITLFGGTKWNEEHSKGIWGPVWWNSDKQFHGVFPFYASFSDSRYLLPFYYHRGDSKRSLLITPLGGGRWGEDVNKTLIFGNFYMTEKTVGLFPFLFTWGESFRQFGPLWWTTDDSFGFFPLFWNFNDFHAALPFYWECGRNRNAGIFPLLNLPLEEESPQKRAYWLLPLFYYSPPRTEKVASMAFHTPLGGWKRNDAGEIDFWHLFGPLFLRNTSDRHSATGIALINWYVSSPLHDDKYHYTPESIVADPNVPEAIRQEAATFIDPERDFSELKQELTAQRSNSWTTWPLLYWKQTANEQTLKAIPADPFFLTPLFSFHEDQKEWNWNCLWLFGAGKSVTEVIDMEINPQHTELEDLLLSWTRRITYQLKQRIQYPDSTPGTRDQELAERACQKAEELGIKLEPTDTVGAFSLLRTLKEEIYHQEVTHYSYGLPFWWKQSSDTEANWLLLGGILGYGSQSEENSAFRILGAVARGKANGDRREFRILEFLYFSEHDGDAHRYTIFPFITYENKGEEENSFSFLWRLFSLRKRDGKHSGHLFFIPFSEE